MNVEEGGRILAGLIILGVVIVIAIGISYVNQAQSNKQLFTALNATGVCTTSNTAASTYCGKNGIYQNASTSQAGIANTAGTNGNYVYYILFAALLITVILGVFAYQKARS